MMGVYQEESDEDLFILLKDDDERAFDLLFKRYWDKLLEVAYNKLHAQEEAEEVVQQVFMEIWNSRHKTELKFTFRTYISAALKYTIFARLAKHKRRNQVRIDSDDSDLFVDDSTQQLLNFNDVRGKLEILLNQLPEKCEMVFRMSREEGLSNKEIAERLDISVKTVETHITKAIKVIKNGLNQPWVL